PAHKGKMKPVDGELIIDRPLASDVRQGNTGDCYLMAAMAAVAHTSPDTIVNQIRQNPDGTVTVRFHVRGKPVDVTVDQSIPVNRFFGNAIYGTSTKKNELWVSMMEKAYAEQFGMGKGYDEGIGQGGFSAEAMEHITGGQSHEEYTSSFDMSDPAQRQELLDILAGASVRPTTASTPKRPWYKEMTDLVGNHAYTVLGTYKDKSGRDMVRIRNPHNVGWMPHGGEFSMTLEKFHRTFRDVQTVHLPPPVTPGGSTTTPTGSAPPFTGGTTTEPGDATRSSDAGSQQPNAASALPPLAQQPGSSDGVAGQVADATTRRHDDADPLADADPAVAEQVGDM